jgi:hypothetical protein
MQASPARCAPRFVASEAAAARAIARRIEGRSK